MASCSFIRPPMPITYCKRRCCYINIVAFSTASYSTHSTSVPFNTATEPKLHDSYPLNQAAWVVKFKLRPIYPQETRTLTTPSSLLPSVPSDKTAAPNRANRLPPNPTCSILTPYYLIICTSLLCLLIVCSCEHVSASAYFNICHKSDPNISMCIKNTIDELRTRLIAGKTCALDACTAWQWHMATNMSLWQGQYHVLG